MPPKRYGRVRYGAGRNKRGVRFGFIRGKTSRFRPGFRHGKRRVGIVRRKRRYQNRKGVGKQGYKGRRKTRVGLPGKYGTGKPTRLQKQLAVAQGNIFLARRQLQCEWKVPLAKTTSGGINYNPAIYCYPREPGGSVANENERMIYPMDNHDVYKIALNQLPAGQDGTNPYQTFLHIGWKATYEIRNQNNFPVKYEALKFRVKRNIPYLENAFPASLEQSWQNPFNVAGNFIQRTGEHTQGGGPDATHGALHKIQCDVQKLPPFQWAFSCKKKVFKLGPGQTKTFTITGRKAFKKIEMIGAEIEASTITHAKMDHWAGSKFICFKMMSAPADYTASEATIWQETSTRTTPVCLLSYAAEYRVLRPIQLTQAITTLELGASGFVADPEEAKIQNMGDDDMKTELQVNTV